MTDERKAFESWWDARGEYYRAGRGQYEKTFAFKAWESALLSAKPEDRANRTSKSVMMSAYALCPLHLPHPEKMEWMANYFLDEFKGNSATGEPQPVKVQSDFTVTYSESYPKSHKIKRLRIVHKDHTSQEFYDYKEFEDNVTSEPEMPDSYQSLGFDPTTHHNEAKFPYTAPSQPTVPDKLLDSIQVYALWQKFRESDDYRNCLNWANDNGLADALFVAFRAGLNARTPKEQP
jgi:hypothetical protein